MGRPAKCPRCGSPDPRRHPATQFEGEVQPCSDPWHGPDDDIERDGVPEPKTVEDGQTLDEQTASAARRARQRIRWTCGRDVLIVPRAYLSGCTDLLPTGVEARVESILTAARFDEIWLNVGDGPLHVTEGDLAAIRTALEARRHFVPERPADPQEETTNRTRRKRAQRKRRTTRLKAAIVELESQNKRLRSAASRALERCEVATDPSGAADEAAFILAEVVRLDGTYVPRDADKPMFEPPELDPDLRAGKH